MASLDLTTIDGVREMLASGEVPAREVCRASLESIEAQNSSLNAFNLVATEQALARAEALDRLAPSERGPLHGVPIAIKDNMCTRGLATTASSKILEGYLPPYDATVVERLERAGAVIVGKTNCDEFAMGSSNENSAFGPARNPWDPTRTPGGSSGGSAVAVAAGTVPAALGSDTGGSIRQPASLCGIVGLKPTYGRVSRYGLLAFASSLDQIGPLTRTVNDAATLLSVLAGPDPRDATAARTAVPDYRAALSGELAGARIGVPRAFVGEGVDAEVRAAFDAALDLMASSGATLVDIDLPHARYAIPVYYLVATAEASSNLARYDGVPLRLPDARRAHAGDHVLQNERRGVRRGGETPDHAGHLRAERGLLRRLLPEGAAGPHADPSRLRAGLRAR